MEVDVSRRGLRLLADLFLAWAQLARGFSPNATSLSEQQIAQANTFARRLAEYIISHADAYPGIRYAVRRHADGLKLKHPEEDPLLAAVFYVDDEDADWHQQKSTQEMLLRDEVVKMAAHPEAFLDRLVGIKVEFADIPHPLFDPLFIIFGEVAKLDTALLPWLQLAREKKLFPDASPLVAATVAQIGNDPIVLETLLDDPQVRPFMIRYALSGSCSDDVLDFIVGRLKEDDLKDLYINVRAGIADDSVVNALLQHSEKGVRSMAAAVILVSSDPDKVNVAEEFKQPFRAALRDVPIPTKAGRRDTEQFLERLVQFDREIYEEILCRTLALPISGDFYLAMQLFARTAPKLDPDAKTRVFGCTSPHVAVQRHVFDLLRGSDIGWVETMLESGTVDAEFVDSCFLGFGTGMPLEELARLLVPRGLDPARVAVTAESGRYLGDDHERLSDLVDRMRAHAESADSDVAAVGKAGLRIYEPKLQDAKRRHRENQVRGRW